MNASIKQQPKRLATLAISSVAIFSSLWLGTRVHAQTVTPNLATTATPKPSQFKPLVQEKILTDTQANNKQLSFVISPPSLELTGKPGETLQTTVKVKNNSDKTQTFRSESFDFIIEADGTTPVPVSEQVSGRWAASSWITLMPVASTLAPGATQEVTVLIQIPKNALPGGHYAMVLHTPGTTATKNKKATGDAALAVTTRSGTLLYLTVAGNIHEDAFIRNFTAPSWVEFGPVNFSYSIENQSDVHIAPQAAITVRDVFGRVMTTEKIESQNIFPYLSKSFSAKWDVLWGFGPYTANLEAGYGSSGKIVSAIARFWIIPYRVILALLVGLGSLVAIIIAVRRHLHHRNNVQTQQIEVLEERIRELEGRNTERGRRE